MDQEHQFEHDIDVFYIGPLSLSAPHKIDDLIAAAGYCDNHGWRGIYIPQELYKSDPWFTAQLLLQHTKHLSPLLKLQPELYHPFGTAKLISAIGHLYGRRLYLDAHAVEEDPSQSDKVIEYLTLLKMLLASKSPVTFVGRFFAAEQLQLVPPPDQTLMPLVLASGTTNSGRKIARALGATAIQHPQPEEHHSFSSYDGQVDIGLRFGIIARETDEEAYEALREFFPKQGTSQIVQRFKFRYALYSALNNLSKVEPIDASTKRLYWWDEILQNGAEYPCLVGSYDRVATELQRFLRQGVRKFFVYNRQSEEEFRHTTVVFARARTGKLKQEATQPYR